MRVHEAASPRWQLPALWTGLTAPLRSVNHAQFPVASGRKSDLVPKQPFDLAHVGGQSVDSITQIAVCYGERDGGIGVHDAAGGGLCRSIISDLIVSAFFCH